MKQDNIWGIILGVAIFGSLWFLLRQSTTIRDSAPIRRASPVLNVSSSYDNEEVREIEYNADGLPFRITIHRHAVAA